MTNGLRVVHLTNTSPLALSFACNEASIIKLLQHSVCFKHDGCESALHSVCVSIYLNAFKLNMNNNVKRKLVP